MAQKLTFRSIVGLIWKMAKPYRWKFYVGTVVRVVSDLSALVFPWVLGIAVNYVTAYGRESDIHYLFLLFGILVVTIIFRMSTINLAKALLWTLGETVAYDMSIRANKHVLSLDLAWQEKEPAGNKMSRISKGTNAIFTYIRTYEGILIEATINFFAVSFIFFTLKWYFGVLIAFFFFSYYYFSYLFTKKMKKIRREEEKKVEALSGVQFETMNSLLTIKSLGLYEKTIALVEKFKKDAQAYMFQRVHTARAFWALVAIYEGFFRIIIFGLAILAMMRGELQVGMIVVITTYFGRISEAAQEYAQATNDLELGRVSLERLQEILLVQPELETQGALPFPSKWKHLEVKNLSFAYHGREVLKDISFSISRGEKVGIVGISGEGKSTLFKLLLKLYAPDQGSIRFHNISLQDIKRNTFTPHVAVVPQETEVLHFSLKDNINLGTVHDELRQNELEKILMISDVSNYLHKLPDGVDTLVGEKGVKLSGGEKQRLGIARALARKPDILLLDEATSHLDSDSEKRILDGLENYLKDTTLISIAHRLSTLKTMDRILVIKGGELVEEGSFETLRKKRGGVFQKLWEKQRGRE